MPGLGRGRVWVMQGKGWGYRPKRGRREAEDWPNRGEEWSTNSRKEINDVYLMMYKKELQGRML